MTVQKLKKTTLSGNSFKLDTLDPNNYYDATLSGSNQSAASHSTLIPASLTNLRGDSLTATSSGSTLYGGAGRDSLTGLGANESLISGTGIDTLVSKGNAATLVGNGLSSLSSTAANAFFLLGTASGDSIGSAGGNATVLLRSSLTSANFSLLDTFGHGVGVASVANLRYQGSGSVTLSGNTLNNYIQGGTGNDYLAGGGGADTLDASTSRGNATLIGNSNGRSTLEGGFGTNSFFLNNIIPDAFSAQAGSHNNITSKFSLNLTASNLQYDSLVYTGSQAVTFTGDALGHTTLNAGIALSATLSDGGGANDYMIGSSAGTNLFKVSSLATDSIQGGTPPTLAGAPRSNTLWSATAAQSVTDSAFSKISGVSILTLSGNDHLTLGSAAQSAGISTIIGNSISGNGSETINASAYTSGITIKVTDPLSSSHFLLQGGSGNDLFQEGYSNLGVSTISGGAGSDTLALSGAGLQSVSDSAFSSVSGVEVLSLTGNTDVTFGNNAYRTGQGFQTIYGGTGVDTFTQTSADPTALTLIGGASAANSFSIATHGELVSDSIVGGGAGDTLIAAYADTDINDLFSKVSRVSAVSLTSASAITLGSAAQSAGIHSVFGGAGGDTITQLSTNNNALAITGGSSAGNLFSIGSRSGLLADSIQGGGNGDTLSLAYADQGMSDAVFSNISGIEALQLSSRSAVTLDGNASGAGIATIYGGSGGDSITQLAGGPTALTVVGGTSPDLVVVGTWDQLLNDSLVGSGKGDTLALGFSDTTDLSNTFGDISGINALQLTSSSSVTLGANAQAEQLNSIFGGAGGDTFVQSGDTNALTIVGGSGNDSITIDTNANFVTDSIIGGAGFDTLTLLESGDISDISFASVSGIEVLSLTSASAVTLGADAQAAGISTIISGAGQDTIFAQSFGAPLTVDVTSASPAAMIIGGAAPETYLVAQGALSASTIQGNSGADTLAIMGADPNITDASFALISGVSALSLTSSSSVILDSNAYNSGAGFQSIYGGAGGDTFIQTANDTNALTIVGGALGANSFAVGLRSELDADSLVGGNAGDTLTLAFADQNLNDPFARMSGIEALSLTSASAVTLGTAAFNEHLSAVYAGAGTGIGNTQGDTITQTAEDTLTMTLAGGAGDDLITVGSRSELLADSLAGNTGTNTLALSYADTALNDSFTRISGFQALQLTNSSAVTLGANASTAGIATVYGGSGSDSISQLSAGPGAVTLIGGTSADYFGVSSWSQLSSDSIIGSGRGDTLSLGFADTTHLNDSFGNIAGINALQLSSASAVTLGGNSALIGISSVYGGIGGDSFTHLASASQAVAFTGGFAGPNSYNISTISQLASDTIVGGHGNDTIFLGAAGNIADSSLAHVSGVAAIQLSSQSSITLGGNAASDHLASVFGGTGGDTFTQTVADTLATTLSGGSGGANSFIIANSSILANDSIRGGGAVDSLIITSASQTLTDSNFFRVSSVEILRTANGSNSVTVGTRAQNAGISTIIGGTGNDLINASAYTSNVSLNGGGSATSADTLTGSTGAGVDTFVLGTTATPFYGTTSAGTGAANYAVVNNFNGSDRLQLSSSQLGHYSLGALHDNSSRSSTAFGLYDNGKIVADVHTSGGFTLATNGTGDTNFLNPTNNHVTFV
jgi:Ca2+-binding RTX toxin-like protein